MLFAEALDSLREYEAIRAAVDVPVLANVTNSGHNEIFTVARLESVGVTMAIYPVSLLRLAMGAEKAGLDRLRADGSLAGTLPRMQTRARLSEFARYDSYNQFDASVFAFDLPTGR